jgi:GMP synthase (glutamine-hydrolysing)
MKAVFKLRALWNSDSKTDDLEKPALNTESFLTTEKSWDSPILDRHCLLTASYDELEIMLIDHTRPSFQRYATGGESESSKKEKNFHSILLDRGPHGDNFAGNRGYSGSGDAIHKKQTGENALMKCLREFTVMIALYQHGAGEPPGYILQLLSERDLEYKIIPLFETGEVTGKIKDKHLVFLGGQMSVNDEKEYPWLLQEKLLIRQAIRSGIPILGICLGAQLIASALGKKVFPCQEERGWCGISKNLIPGPVMPGNNLTVFQWHGENFELPDGAVLEYRGDLVENQMFTIGSAMGVQFHPEVTGEIIHDWVITAGRKEQDEIMLQTSRHINGSNQICRSIITRFLEGSTV